jgi:DNA polymerase (family 10)
VNPQITYSNQDVFDLLQKIAIAYEIKNKSYFQIQAYQNAAETIVNYPQSLFKLWQKDKNLIDQIPGIGDSILAKIDYLFTHHQNHPHVKKIFEDIHPAVFVFTKINGIGPKNAFKLTQNLKFSKDPTKALKQLVKYAQKGSIQKIETFGEKSEKLILDNTLQFLGNTQRLTLAQAQKISLRLISYLQKRFPKVEFVPLGSLRRLNKTVGDIDIAAKSENSSPILNYFVAYPLNLQTIIKGPKKASIKIKNNIRLDLMVQPKTSFGSLLQHFTGSRQHNIKLREFAKNKGYSLSEYGIKDLKTGKLHTFEDETSFYNFLGLNFIPLEARQGVDEIEKAKI